MGLCLGKDPATDARQVTLQPPSHASSNSNSTKELYSVVFEPHLPLGILRRAVDQVVISHTVEAGRNVITNVRVGDKLVKINGEKCPQDPDFVNIMLVSLREDNDPYEVTFCRQSLEDPPTLVDPPDFFDDSVEWFCYWDYDTCGRIVLDNMIHAISFSFRLPEDQLRNLRRGLSALWPKWDITGLGIDVLTFIEPNSLASVMSHPLFFDILGGQIFERDEEGDEETDRAILTARLEGRDQRKSITQEMDSKIGQDHKEAISQGLVRSNEDEKVQKKVHDQLVKVLQMAIETRNAAQLEKQIDHWKASPDNAPKELLDQAHAILEEDMEARRVARAQEAESILTFASTNLRGLAGLARLEKALEQTSRVPGFDNSKWRDMYNRKKQRVDSLLKTCTIETANAKELIQTKSEDTDNMSACRDKLDVALKAAIADDLIEEIRDADTARKKLHNRIQDVRGGTRVFCRVRPLASDETNEVCTKTSSMDIVVQDDGTNKDEAFMFDAVFDAKNGQADVFVDCEDLVISALDGHNITIFAYGQTGAGKTHTMAGTEREPGVVTRTIQAVYEAIERNSHLHVEVSVYMVELYNNKIVDLLSDAPPLKDGLKIRYDSKNNVVVLEPPPTPYKCANVAGTQAVLDKGSSARRTACTQMNSDSSRSHLFTVLLLKSSVEGRSISGKITLIDLAGSERLKKSAVSGSGQQEAIEINKSLTALGDVISGLTSGKKRSEIPYRNHKLTQILQDSLGGTSKTIMFVCARPDDANIEETIISLKYAQRARNIINLKPKPVNV